MSADLFSMIGHALTPIGTSEGRAHVQKIVDDTLQWDEFDDLGVPGWSLHMGYTVEREPGDAPSVWIHRAVLNTGQREIELALNEISVRVFEAEISERVEAADKMQAAYLSRRDADDQGDWLYEARKDKQA